MSFFSYVSYFLFLQISSFTFGKDVIRGVNIGGWLVLEPWITPSLFYPFLGTVNKIGMDMYTFCDILGPKEANRKLKKHWSTWIDESHIDIFIQNNINLLRVPVGDWMYIPYGPYLTEEDGIKCTDGAIEILDNLFAIAEKKNIEILIDLHTVKGSQNGFDNSGQSRRVEIHKNHFTHWDIREANWIGDFDITTKKYTSYNNESIQHSIQVLDIIIQKYATYSAFYGLNVLNEPWEYTPVDFLQSFYQEIFDIFTLHMPSNKVFIIHDSFRSQIWNTFEFARNDKNFTIYLDTHQYTAWNQKYDTITDLFVSSKGWQSPLSKYAYLIGEWSLAIDNCEMWLNGFMDNVPNYPLFECTYRKCPKYTEHLLELSYAKYGPFGSGVSYPLENNVCPVSIPLQTHFGLDIEEYILARQLFDAKSSAFEKNSAGWVYWNFRTESGSYQWDFLSYVDMISNNNMNTPIYAKQTNNNSIIHYTSNVIIILCIIVLTSILAYYVKINISNMYRRRHYKIIHHHKEDPRFIELIKI